MASGYGKKSLKEQFNSAVRKVIAATVFAGAAASPVWYHYGTVQEQDVKITSIEKVEVKKSSDKAQGASSSGYQSSPSYFQSSPYGSPSNTNYFDDVYGSGSYDDPMYFYGGDEPGGSSSFFAYTPEPAPGTYEYIIHTDRGSFRNADTYSHLKFDSEDLQQRLAVGQTYHIKSYGISFDFWGKALDFSPNILKAYPLTELDIQERDAAMTEKDKKEDVPGQGTVQPPTVAAGQGPVQQQQTMSGEMVTYPVVVGGYSVQLTIPAETVGKVTVNSVRPAVLPSPKR